MVATSPSGSATGFSDDTCPFGLHYAGQLIAQMNLRSHSPDQGLQKTVCLVKLQQAYMFWAGICKCSRQKLDTTCRGETYPLSFYSQGCDVCCKTWRLGSCPESVIQLQHKCRNHWLKFYGPWCSTMRLDGPSISSLLACRTVTTLKIKTFSFPLSHSAVSTWKGKEAGSDLDLGDRLETK